MKSLTAQCLISSLVLAVCRADTSYETRTLKKDFSPKAGDEEFMAGWPEEDIIEFRQYYACVFLTLQQFWTMCVMLDNMTLSHTAYSFFSNGGVHHTEGGIINHGSRSAGYGYTHYGHSGYVPTATGGIIHNPDGSTYVPTATGGIIHNPDGSTYVPTATGGIIHNPDGSRRYGYSHYGNNNPAYRYANGRNYYPDRRNRIKYCDAYGRCWYENSKEKKHGGVKTALRAKK